MAPKSGRKRAASTESSQESKAPKPPRQEPIRTSRRLRSASPSNHSPLRALSPPKKRGRRKPKSIPEEVEEEQRHEETQATSRSQGTIDHKNVTESQDSNVNEPTSNVLDFGEDGNEGKNISQFGAPNEAESVRLSTELSNAHENGADLPATQQESDEQLQVDEDPNKQPMTEKVTRDTEPQFESNNVPTDDVQTAGDENVHFEGENNLADVDTTENQLYTSKTISPFAVEHEPPCVSKVSYVESNANPSASPNVLETNSSSGYDADSSDAISEDLEEKTNDELRFIIQQLKEEPKETLCQRTSFRIQSQLSSDTDDNLKLMLHKAAERANSFKVQSQASRKLIESQRIQLQQLREGEIDDNGARFDDTSSRKRPASALDASAQRSPRRVKTSHNQQQAQEMILSQELQTKAPERAAADTILSTENVNDFSIQPFPNASGDYLMSGALNHPSDNGESPYDASKLITIDDKAHGTPETPSASNWGRLFNPVASVRRLFTFVASPRTDPPPRNRAPESPHFEASTGGSTSKEDSARNLELIPPLRDAFGILRQRRHVNFNSTQYSDEDAIQRVPGSFVSFDEEPITPAGSHKQGLPRHSFMPQTAPHPRRAQSGLQRRLQQQRQSANAEAKNATEAKARKAREQISESDRFRRETLKARSLDIPPDVIRSSFVNKFGASAREIQQAQEKEITIGTKRKARCMSPEAIPNPPGASYGINDDYFDDDDSVLIESSGENTNRSQQVPDATKLITDLRHSDSTTPTPTTDETTLISRLFGSFSKSVKRQRLDGDSTSYKSMNNTGADETSNDNFHEFERADTSHGNEKLSHSERRKIPYDRDSSYLPPLRFKKDALTGQLEPIKVGGGPGSRKGELQDETFAPPVAPWYSGPFTPSNRSRESPSDQLFRSPSVLNMKPRHEFKGDFVSEPMLQGDAFSSRSHHEHIGNEYDSFDGAADTQSTLEERNATLISPEPSSSSDLAMTIVNGQKFGFWNGPKGTGQFAVPESDSDEDNDEEQISQMTPSQVSSSNTDSSASIGGNVSTGASRMTEEGTRTLRNVFSMTQTDSVDDTGVPDTQKPSSQEPSQRSNPDAPAIPATPTSKDTDALARARSQAEKYKPKTPSTLRAISAMSSPFPLQDEQHVIAGGEDDESGEEVGPITPRLSPTGPITHPTSRIGEDDNTQELFVHARDLANKIPSANLPIDQFPQWPTPQPAPWAELVDEQVRTALDADSTGSRWDAYSDQVWKTAVNSWKKGASADAA